MVKPEGIGKILKSITVLTVCENFVLCFTCTLKGHTAKCGVS